MLGMRNNPSALLGSPRRDISLNICGLWPRQRWWELSSSKLEKELHWCISACPALSLEWLSLGSKLSLCGFLPEAFQSQAPCRGGLQGTELMLNRWVSLANAGLQNQGVPAAALLGAIPQSHLDPF